MREPALLMQPQFLHACTQFSNVLLNCIYLKPLRLKPGSRGFLLPKQMSQAAVYAIICDATGRLFVSATLNRKRRWAVEREQLRSGNHHNPHLQADWAWYGERFFSFRVLEEVSDAARLADREHAWIKHLRATGKRTGYNLELPSLYERRREIRDMTESAKKRRLTILKARLTDEDQQVITMCQKTGKPPAVLAAALKIDETTASLLLA